MCVLTMWVFAWIRLWSYLNSQFLAGELSVVSALFFVHDDMIWHQFSGTEFHPCKSSHPGPSSCWTTSRNMEPSQLPHTLITALVCGAPCGYPITPQMCPGDAMTHLSWLKRQTTFTSCCWSEVLRSAEVEGGNKHILNIYFGGLMNLKSCGAGWGKLKQQRRAFISSDETSIKVSRVNAIQSWLGACRDD